jgi:hypothetical protein
MSKRISGRATLSPSLSRARVASVTDVGSSAARSRFSAGRQPVKRREVVSPISIVMAVTMIINMVMLVLLLLLMMVMMGVDDDDDNGIRDEHGWEDQDRVTRKWEDHEDPPPPRGGQRLLAEMGGKVAHL